MRDLSHINAYRIEHPLFAGEMGDVFNGVFEIDSPKRRGVKLTIMSGNGLGWDHVSVSAFNKIKGKSVMPSWSDMSHVKELFFNDNETVVQFHPKKEEYVNIHSKCLHLWRNQSVEYELPAKGMV